MMLRTEYTTWVAVLRIVLKPHSVQELHFLVLLVSEIYFMLNAMCFVFSEMVSQYTIHYNEISLDQYEVQ